MIFTIDPLHSLVEFSVQHLKISLVKGRFSEVHGIINLDTQQPEKTTIQAQVKVDSIYTGSAQRDAHLRSSDFFNVSKNPYMLFESTRVRLIDQNHCLVDGNFTMHGVTRPITFQVTYTGTNRDPLTEAWRIGLSGVTTIDRRDFGMVFNRRLIDGIAAIGNETRIEIHIEAIQTS
ncbi:YceI family protein [Dictyobacter aurantiacus]|uniref:Polyisoprenoid-binding protein n=1 Tax=Dictyobacter aurantiacus TaxID=1936993 RepID=A0A401ZIN7_9CHLR|nr:YceI family protein [Dictyobacter aurantiacus]GCE06716.1 polyisoprenoid-binding protein [Dictyobacter aurantiacus]